MSRIFKSRSSVRKAIPDRATRAKCTLEKEIEKEVTVVSIAMPFLPRDQVRGLVLKKLGLQTGSNEKTILRKGGARINYKNISFEFPKSQNIKGATSKESPRYIRKKLLRRSEAFQIVGHRAEVLNQEKTSAEDAFTYSLLSPEIQVPVPFKRQTPRRPQQALRRKTPKRRLFSFDAEEVNWRLERTEQSEVAEDYPANQLSNATCSSTPKVQATRRALQEEEQSLKRNQEARIQSMDLVSLEDMSERRRPVGANSDEETSVFDENTDDDRGNNSNVSSPESVFSLRRRSLPTTSNSPDVSNNKDPCLEECPVSPVLRTRRLTSRLRELSLANKSLARQQTEGPLATSGDLPRQTSPITQSEILKRRDGLSLSNKSTIAKPAEPSQRNGGDLAASTARNITSPVRARALLPLVEVLNEQVETLETLADISIDTAAVPDTPSDAASTSITPPEIRKVPESSEEISPRNSTGKNCFSDTPQSAVVTDLRMESEYQPLLLSNQRHSPEDVSSQRSSNLRQQREHPAGSREKSTKSSTHKDRCKDRPESALTVDSREPYSSFMEGVSVRPTFRSNSSTPQSANPYLAWNRNSPVENAAYPESEEDSSILTPTKSSPLHRSYLQEKEDVPDDSRKTKPGSSTVKNDYVCALPLKSKGRSSSRSKSSTPQSASQTSLTRYPACKQGSSTDNTAYSEPERGSSDRIPTRQSSQNAASSKDRSYPQEDVSDDSGKTKAGSSTVKDHYVRTLALKSRGPSSSRSNSSTPQSTSQIPLAPYPASKQGSSTDNIAYSVPARGSSDEISTWQFSQNVSPLMNSSYPQEKKDVSDDSCKTKTGSSTVKDHYGQTLALKSRGRSSSRSNSSTPQSASRTAFSRYRATKQGSSTDDVSYSVPEQGSLDGISTWKPGENDTSPGNQSVYSISVEETPTTSRPYRGQSTKKGIPWTNQVPNRKITARRALFHNPKVELNSLNSQDSQGTITEKHAKRHENLLTTTDQDQMEISEGTPVLFESQLESDLVPKPRRHNRTISVNPLLLQKGADRVDGLPFKSGEAVRPFTSEWLHQKKLDALTDSPYTPGMPVAAQVFNEPENNVKRSVRSIDPHLCHRKTSPDVLPLQTTGSISWLEDELQSSDEQLPATIPVDQISQQADEWWQEGEVQDALALLGMEKSCDASISSKDLPASSSQQSVQSVYLSSQESNVQEDASSLSPSPPSNFQRNASFWPSDQSSVQRNLSFLSSRESSIQRNAPFY